MNVNDRIVFLSTSGYALIFDLRAPTVVVNLTQPTGGAIDVDVSSYGEVAASCGPQCAITENLGSFHSYIARSAAGYRFKAWGGPCTGQGATCSLAAEPNLPPIKVAFSPIR